MTTTNPVRAGRRYGRLIYAILGIGIVSLLGGMFVDLTLPGLVVYAVAAVLGVGLTFYFRFRDDVVLNDERDMEVSRRASSVTFQLFGYLGLFAFVALFLLDATGRRPLGPAAETLLYAYAVVTLTWGAVYGVLKYRT